MYLLSIRMFKPVMTLILANVHCYMMNILKIVVLKGTTISGESRLNAL